MVLNQSPSLCPRKLRGDSQCIQRGICQHQALRLLRRDRKVGGKLARVEGPGRWSRILRRSRLAEGQCNSGILVFVSNGITGVVLVQAGGGRDLIAPALLSGNENLKSFNSLELIALIHAKRISRFHSAGRFALHPRRCLPCREAPVLRSRILWMLSICMQFRATDGTPCP